MHARVRRAVSARLTCPAEVACAERALGVVTGPDAKVSRKGIEDSRQWLESQTESVEVLAGDDPREDAERLSAAVLLSNVTSVPRVDALQEKAVDAQDKIETEKSSRSEEVTELITDENNELDPI
jgi:cell division GTPase FtsZ